MRYVVIAGLMGMLLASPARAQMLPLPFEHQEHIVCIEQRIAVDLMTTFEEDDDLGENVLAHLAELGMCERAAFSGKPVADTYPDKLPADKLTVGHVFEVETTTGTVLNGRTRAYMLLYVIHDNEA